jgi:hypothetical protein
MGTLELEISQRPALKPRITLEFVTPGDIKCNCENFPREMKLTAVNVLANGALVFVVEPVPSPIIKPNMQN